MDIVTETVERLNHKSERDERAFGLGGTDAGLKLTKDFFEPYLEIYTEKQKASKCRSFRGRKTELLNVNPEELTLSSLFSGIGAVGVTLEGDLELAFTNALRYIGKACEHLCYSTALRAWDAKQAAAWEKQLKRASTLAYRQRLLKRKAKEKGFVYEDWQDEDRLHAGAWVVEGLLAGPVFAIDGDGLLTLSEEAHKHLDLIMEGLILMNAFVRPQTEPLAPWDGPTTHIEGFKHSLVRTGQKAVQRHIQSAFKQGTMGPTLEAINHAQAVAWRINAPILELVRGCFEMNLGVPGLPPKHPLEVPTLSVPWDTLNEDQQRIHMKKVGDIKTANKGFIGEAIVLKRDLATAESLLGKTFWTHMNLDYRGRVYGMPHFNFQRSDAIRAMFMFEEGQVLTTDGLYWLKVHTATCGAFNKVDKAPFAERVAWVDDNLELVLRIAEEPLVNLKDWIEADSPFLFVAACMALKDGLEGLPVHIPTSFDGSCSGLQHLCALTRATEGKFVNLTPSDRPQDVYQIVADRVKARVETDLLVTEDAGANDKTPNAVLAKRCLAYGIGRSLVKRNVMTYSYSSKKSGMKDQIMEDTMRPLRFKVMTGELKRHPLGDDFRDNSDTATYLAGHTFEAIEEVVERPALAMKFLQSVARLYAHEGKPVVWHTPLGFPVMLRYPNLNRKQVCLYLHDRGITLRKQSVSYSEGEGINKRKAANGIAPSFVHSLDACHLMSVLLACKAEGINSVALVHDSFGCLPNDAPRFRQLIKQTFRDMYEQHDVLEDFRKEAMENLDAKEIPPAPEKGTLDLSEIMDAEYCFA